jgi:Flp pilus assembly protein protease CpaA
MQILADIIVLITLVILAVQDFRCRQISWWLLPVLALGILCSSLLRSPVEEVGFGFLCNFIFFILQMVLVWFWFRIRKGKAVRIVDQQIGLGDILFIPVLCAAFSPANFFVFYFGGLVCVLIFALIIQWMRSNQKLVIPLAGALAVPLAGAFVWRMIDPDFNFHDDRWFYLMLN